MNVALGGIRHSERTGKRNGSVVSIAEGLQPVLGSGAIPVSCGIDSDSTVRLTNSPACLTVHMIKIPGRLQTTSRRPM